MDNTLPGSKGGLQQKTSTHSIFAGCIRIVIEVLTESENSWEDAADQALIDASKSVRNIKSIYVKEFQAVVENNKIAQYHINAKISFMYEGG